jgi:hypothetical protein
MNTSLHASIDRQRSLLQRWLSTPLGDLADECVRLWPRRHALEERLVSGLLEIPYCKYLYVLDEQARQVTSNASRQGLLDSHYGRDRSARPYLAQALAGERFSMSQAYISRNSRRPSLTAVRHIVDGDGGTRGYLAADFDLRELPITQASYRQPSEWMQLKGDPAIRSGLFYQERVNSPLDQNMDIVLPTLEELITINGVFHLKLHFSSSRATLWTVDDPFRFRIHGIEDLTHPDLCLAYSHRDYPADAGIPALQIGAILQQFRQLRFLDENIYLRAGMLNIFNGMVGLTFSCDGSHYMPWDEFLERDIGFWIGKAGNTCTLGDARLQADPRPPETVRLAAEN